MVSPVLVYPRTVMTFAHLSLTSDDDTIHLPAHFVITDIIALKQTQLKLKVIDTSVETLFTLDGIPSSFSFSMGLSTNNLQLKGNNDGVTILISGFVEGEFPVFSQVEVDNKIKEINDTIGEKITELATKEIDNIKLDILAQKLIDKIRTDINNHIDNEIALLKVHIDDIFKK